ncbi:MAG: TrmH family RNA methyltransferase [Formosimonas sp.]
MITSKDNPAIKQLKRWLDKPRRSDDVMLLEGIHLAQAFFAQGGVAQRIWVAHSALANAEIAALVQPREFEVMSDALFRSVSTLAQGESILCEVRKPSAQGGAAGNAVLLDGVQDAGNLGSILRSAAAAGVRDVYLNSACANPFAPKVLRAAVGAHFSLNIVDGVDILATMRELQSRNVAVLATSLQAQHSIYQTDLAQPCAWLMGSEGAGVAAELLDVASQTVIIPMCAGESLNVAAASAVCLFEMARQQSSRRTA